MNDYRAQFDAASGIAQSLAASQCSIEATPDPDLMAIDKMLSGARAQVREMTERAHGLADQLYGPRPPQPVSGTEKGISASGAIGQVRYGCATLAEELIELNQALNRFSRLA